MLHVQPNEIMAPMTGNPLHRLSFRGLARVCASHPRTTIGIWAVALVVFVLIASTTLSSVLTTQISFTNNPESARADKLLQDRLSGPRKANEVIIVASSTLTVDDDAFQQAVTDLYGKVMALGTDIVASGVNYYQVRANSLVSADRRTTIIPVTMAGTLDDASTHITAVRNVVSEANGGNGFQTYITGDATSGQDFSKVAESDLVTGEIFGIPAALIILVLVFGAAAAALVPLGLALVSIGLALGATALVGQIFSLSFFVTNMITMMGLAIGVDYSLFIVSRYREERGKGLDKNDAISAAGATASRAVFFSGMTVVVALLGMLFVPTTIFRSLGTGAILVVIATMLASLTLLPAVLSVVGDRVNSWRLPFLQRRGTVGPAMGGGFWRWVARTIMRRPVISLTLAAVILIAAAMPYFGIRIGAAGIDTLPPGLESREGFIILKNEFSAGLTTPVDVVIDGDISSPAVQGGVQRLEAILLKDKSFGPAMLTTNTRADLALLAVQLNSEYISDDAIAAIKRLRATYIPEAFSAVPATVLVTGATAGNVDYFDLTNHFMPIVIGFVLALSFLLLTVVFRSLIVPLKAILMNLLAVGATYGLLVVVFQKGVGARLFGFQQVESIEAWIPLFLFSVLFGLSMDYHVFLLSRIRERYDQGYDNSEAVVFGLVSTGRIITGAAFIMVAVFGGFAAGQLVMFQEMGFGLAVAVFMDATVVRSIIVPSAMKLLGRANWYLPSWLRWLPDLRVDGRTEKAH
ncbi:MAG TPA: MMPL family transporter [Dehalococcoidia bacterium]|nr:MMPL family transporter [Dehalococcoidia bacterium]